MRGSESVAMTEVEHTVVIVGGVPTGLMLAGELALAGIDVAIVEPRANQDPSELSGTTIARRPFACCVAGRKGESYPLRLTLSRSHSK